MVYRSPSVEPFGRTRTDGCGDLGLSSAFTPITDCEPFALDDGEADARSRHAGPTRLPDCVRCYVPVAIGDRITLDRTHQPLETRPVADRPSWRDSAEPGRGRPSSFGSRSPMLDMPNIVDESA
jgi:hypothetical protein